MTIEYLWDGGGGSQELYTIVRGPWTRVDRGLPDGNTRTAQVTQFSFCLSMARYAP